MSVNLFGLFLRSLRSFCLIWAELNDDDNDDDDDDDDDDYITLIMIYLRS